MPSDVVTTPVCAIGASLTAAMLIVNDPTLLNSEPSKTWNVTTSLPFAFAFGVYLKAPAAASVITAVPFDPFATIENSREGPSTSVTWNDVDNGVSSTA